MFETSGITDVMEGTPWQRYALWFAAGCFVTILITYMFVLPYAKRNAAESAEKAAQQKFSAELAKNPLEAQLESTKTTLQSATQERDACQARFDRQTVLYDNSIVVSPEKVWIIPADVEPIVIGDHSVSYTHLDLKTKRETVRFQPKRQ
jgi:hypothetical protein